MPKPVLVTGAAGFIGSHVTRRLIRQGHAVVGIDEINDYYDPALKHARLKLLDDEFGQAFTFRKMDIAEDAQVSALFREFGFAKVVHLAAQAGVRYSLKNPFAYQRSNLAGMISVLEACRHANVEHLVYASSSSVYGTNSKVPFLETDPVNNPISLYAATKRANELMAHTYGHLFALPNTGLRFFTVYGPWGRPDMAYWSFTDAMLRGQPIKVFGEGLLARDFTYIDDIVDGVVNLLDKVPPETERSRILNIGNSQPVSVNEMISALEKVTGQTAIREFMPTPPGDVAITFADSSRLESLTGYRPSTTLEQGLDRFVKWYRLHYGR